MILWHTHTHTLASSFTVTLSNAEFIGAQTGRAPGLAAGQDALLSSGGGYYRAGGPHQHHNVPGLLPLAGQ